jgi:hypothetical protein
MKVFSDKFVERTTVIPSIDGFPRNPVAPCMFYHSDLKRVFLNIGEDDWHIIPYGTYDMLQSYKSSPNIKVLEGKKIPYDIGGTYLIDSDNKADQKYAMPPCSLANGITYHIKNIGNLPITLVTENDDTIEKKNAINLHPNQCTTFQSFEENWYILNTYTVNQL